MDGVFYMSRRVLKYETVKDEKSKIREEIKRILLERISLIEEAWCEEDENSGLLQGFDGE